ncbi:Ig-like domain-containing protein [Neobacillus sp. CF12]|uniref:Ig-like domain-containing protein n=1 Tax=Neobacillus sp. CF12 TaxID=3055864 RepID=UPI0025A188F6|nr:Ig-like domain-containing protein [Neobacillus sp. CF12]MDM5329898.1 Ig-like domain-containing protein [Neobacillus sp. CF12]
MGFIDSPSAGSTVSGVINVRGWIVDNGGVSKVEVFVDGKVVGQAKYGSPRSDVHIMFPEYQNANAGYEFSFDTRSLSNGSHSISVKSTSKTGSTLQLQGKTVNVQNIPPIGHIDAPAANSSINGITNVRGWFLDFSGISKVEVFVDGKNVGLAKYGSSRPDVLKVLPEYQNANAGYEFALDTTKLTNGTHAISVKGTGKSGSSTELQTKTVNVKNLPTVGFMDTPKNGSTITGITNVRGWFLDASGVSKVEVLVDGQIVGQAQYGSPRPDVLNVLPAYQNANAGYEFALDTTKLSNGLHSITVRETGKNGASSELQGISVNVKNAVNLELVGFMDAPSKGSILNGISTIRGWFLDDDGIARVDVLVDGKIVGQAMYGLSRLDVQKFYPEYNNANSGYEYALDTKNYSNGTHMITVKATSKNGSTKQFESSVSIQNLDHLPTMGFIDSPKPGSTIAGKATIRGWYLDGSGVEKIEVFMDGKLVGNAQYGFERLDVKTVFPEYFNSNAGFEYSLDTTQFTDGSHTLTIKETGKSGKSNTLTASITINNGNPYLLLNLMKPANITANDIVTFFDSKNHPNSPFKKYAQTFIDAQNRYGVNAQYLVAHAIWETGWGGSDLIGYKNNLYGYGAYDPCPFTCGYYFQSVEDSIFRVAYQIRVDYLNESGIWYEGPNLIGMNVNYATDPNWKNGIANLMQSMKRYDSSYYSNTKESGMSTIAPPPMVRDIPAGLPYPEDVVISFPSGINAKVVNTPTVNFRSIPYVLASTFISKLSQGTTVTVLGYNTDVLYDPTSSGNYAYRWYKVSVNGQIGWINGEYLEIQNLAQVDLESGTLNIRSTAADSGNTILASVSNGSYLNLVTTNGVPVIQNGWYQVNLPNSKTTGWVHGDFIKLVTN